MEQNFIMTLRKSGNSLCITVPKQIRRLLDLREGNIIDVKIKKIKEKWKD